MKKYIDIENIDGALLKSALKVVQLLFLFTLLPIFTLAVNPIGLLDPLPPGTEYYIYSLWPKQIILATLFCLGIMGSLLSYLINKRETLIIITSLWSISGLLWLTFLTLYWSAHLYQIMPYQTNYEIWYGQIIHGDGLIWTTIWWLLLPLGSLMFRPFLVSKRAVIGIVISAFVLGAVWIFLNRLGIEPTALLNPNIKVRDIMAGFGNRSWAGFIFGLFYLCFFVTLLSNKFGHNAALLPFIFLATLVVTMTGGRMGLVSTAAALLVCIGVITRQRGWQPVCKQLVLPLAVTLAAGITSYTTGLANPQRLTGLAHFSTDGGFTHRLIPWKAGLRVMAQHPLWGEHSTDTGKLVWRNITPEETKELLTEFAPREVIEKGNYKFSDGSLAIVDDIKKTVNVSSVQFSRFHNQYIELGVRGGILLPLVYLALMLSLLRPLITSQHLVAVFAGSVIIAYLFFNLTWFTGPIVEPFVFALIGIGLSFARPHSNVLPSHQLP